jgi:uncharacterized membrane protein
MNSKTRVLLSRAGIVPLCERDRRVIERVAQRTSGMRAGEPRVVPSSRVAASLSALRAGWPLVLGVPVLALAWIGVNLLVFSQVAFDLRLFAGLNLLVAVVGALQAGIVVTARTVDWLRSREGHARSPIGGADAAADAATLRAV